MATIAIGDIHGHLSALEDLLGTVLPALSANDTLVFLGDYIDKGPQIRECVDRVIRLRKEAPCPVVTLLGNHEQYMLRSWKDPTAHSWIWIGGLETIESYSVQAAASIRTEIEKAGPRFVTETVRLSYHDFFERLPAAHAAFFSELTMYHETEDVVCTHAGVKPGGVPVHLQNADDLIWGAERFPQDYEGEKPVVYGHWDNSVEDGTGWPQPRILNNRTFGIDTISRGVLTAARFPDGRIFQSTKTAQ
jgi:serine/threonine protein phosphatase 1